MSSLVPQFQSPAHTSRWLASMQPQMALALPKHLNVERMTRLALTAFSTNPQLAECSPTSVAASIMTASQLGLEIGVNGQGYLIPYKGQCTFVPGWKGIVDLANRGGRCTVWTGAVYRGDEFEYALGDNPFVRHRPGDEVNESYETLEYVYAIGRIKGQEVPVIEVWRRSKVDRHLAKFNKVGPKHYALKNDRLNFEMYARKIPLLQVLKYMPQSIELSAAIHASHAAEDGRTINIDSATWVTTENPSEGEGDAPAGDQVTEQDARAHATTTADGAREQKPVITSEELAKRKGALRAALKNGQAVNEVVQALETKFKLTDDQKMEIAGWAQEPANDQGATQ